MNSIKFVSLGPGEPELITLKALNTLNNSDYIFHPSVISESGKEASLSYSIMNQLSIPKEKMIPFAIRMIKDRRKILETYKHIASELKNYYEKGYNVSIVAEGDAGFFATTHYIYEYLCEYNIPSERIAGVPAFIAAGALGKIHIAKQKEELHIVPGTIKAEDLQNRLEQNNVVIVMKTSLCEAEIKKCINNYPSATYNYFENIGIVEKEFYTKDINTINNRKFPYFSIMIIQKII